MMKSTSGAKSTSTASKINRNPAAEGLIGKTWKMPLMKKRILLIALLLSSVGFGDLAVTYTIDSQQNRSPISPLIYGTNFDHVTADNLTVRRMGGNRLTGYNWENNFSNAGSDWYHHSDEYMSSYIPSSQRQTPGKVMTDFIDRDIAAGRQSVITLPMAGYVAADKNGTVAEADAAPSARWKEVVFKKQAAFCNPPGSPNKTDGFVYMDEFVNYLVSRYGDASTPAGVKFYAMDNEPALWSHTHARIHPAKPTCREMITRTTGLAGAVKDVDPYAQICGPVLYGFGAFNDFQGATDWSTVKAGKPYRWFIDFYLDEMKLASQAQDRRLLDVLDLHWYPEARDADDVRITDFRSTSTNYQTRMQAPRTLWDPDYTENSWIGQWFKWALPLLPRVKTSIDTYYPGTKLGVTEYSYGGANHISGGIAQADVLGIFGKYGVSLATIWGNGGSYTSAAFNLYRNVDGSHSTFGDISVQASMSDKVNSSIYASAFSEDDNRLSLIVLNKNLTETISGTFQLNSPQRFTSGRVWAFDQVSASITERTPVAFLPGNSFTCSIPPLTACHIVLVSERPAADLTGDCVVDLEDLWLFIDQWLSGGLCPSIQCADLEADGVIDLADLEAFSRQWQTGTLCP
jgi:hypothetical protein